MNIEFEPEQEACITIIGGDGPPKRAPARMLSVTGRQVSLKCNMAAPVGTPVKVESFRYLILAEVTEFQSAAGVIVLHIRHAFDLRELDQVRRKWM
jgi:hypothetical protein